MSEGAMFAKRLLPAVISMITLAVFAGSAGAVEKAASFTKMPTVKGIETLKAGAKAPDFAVTDLTDKEFRLKDSLDKGPTLLFFWSFFCGPCREEIPMINEMTKEYKEKGLTVVGVNLDGRDMKKAVDKFYVAEKLAFRIVFDELVGDAFAVADPYGVAGTPALFLVDKDSTITFSVVGAVTGDQLRKEIAKVVK
jgi:peroxiredoxin